MREIVQRYFAAMQRGPDGHDALLNLFTDNAVYVEPFSGDGVHVGRQAIGAWLAATAGQAPPQLTLTVERLDVDGDTVDTTWCCESPAFARPSRGRDRFTVRNGKISRLETTLLEPPEFRE
jgi:ketosteroid isomerase-like protein